MCFSTPQLPYTSGCFPSSCRSTCRTSLRVGSFVSPACRGPAKARAGGGHSQQESSAVPPCSQGYEGCGSSGPPLVQQLDFISYIRDIRMHPLCFLQEVTASPKFDSFLTWHIGGIQKMLTEQIDKIEVFFL